MQCSKALLLLLLLLPGNWVGGWRFLPGAMHRAVMQCCKAHVHARPHARPRLVPSSKPCNCPHYTTPAGASQHASAEQTTAEVAAALLRLNLQGPMNLTRATLPHMIEQRRGRWVQRR